MTREKADQSNPYDQLNEELERMKRPERVRVSIWFVVFMLVLAAGLAALSYWQFQRLDEKQSLMETISARSAEVPFALPAMRHWESLDASSFEYRPLIVRGSYVREGTVLVFGNLDSPKGAKGGPGYWVMTPLKLDSGGAIIVNRGFVPQGVKDWYDGHGEDVGDLSGQVEVTGIGRRSEPIGTFTPGPDINNRIDFVRNVGRMTDLMPAELGPFAQFYIDRVAGPPGELPQGGETRLSLANRHFEYALTWAALCVVTLVMTGIWVWRHAAPDLD